MEHSRRRMRLSGLGPGLAAVITVAALAARADVAIEQIGAIESLSFPPDPHWVWVNDALLERSALIDLGNGRMLGLIDGGWGFTSTLFSADAREIYVAETHYSRGSRGERTDVVTLYDTETLRPTSEVVIPPKRAMNVLPVGNAALSDDGRFVAVFNMTPATSLSIVDVRERRFAGEISTPGCSLVYAAGPRRFAMLCADGALLTVELDDKGAEQAKKRSERFFDPQADPVTEKAVRYRDRWLFVSFEGQVYEVDVSGPQPRFERPWSLLDAADRQDSWRVGGSQHLAVHAGTGRLYSLVHQGGPDTHKAPGSELWVYDLAKRERLQRIELRSPGLTYLGVSIEFGQGWIWPFNGLYDGLLGMVPEFGVWSIAVTQDETPLLVTTSTLSGSVAVYDALSGEFLRRLATGNLTAPSVQAPWGAAP